MVAAKVALRRSILSARSATDPSDRAADDAALLDHLGAWAGDALGGRAEALTIAAHVPVDPEPGAAAMSPEALIQLFSASAGSVSGAGPMSRRPRIRLLLPVCPPGAPAALDWAVFSVESGLAPGRYGIPEPVGPRLGAMAIARADLVVVPGVAADRAGLRMGRGAGYYDRSLALAGAGPEVAVVLHRGEVVDSVPHDEHDRPVGAIITADGIIRPR